MFLSVRMDMISPSPIETQMTRKPPDKKPKLTDAERHKRFVETAKKLEASDKLEDFDKAFSKVVMVKERL